MLMGATIALNAGSGAVFALVAEIQDEHGFTTSQLGYITGALFLTTVLCLLALSHLADRGHARAMLLAGLLVGSASLAWFALAEELWEFVASRALSGLALSLFLAAGRSIVVRLDPAHIGHNLGRLAGAEVGGFVLGPVLGSQLFKLGGLPTPFWTLAAVAALAMVFFLVRFPTDMGTVAQPSSMPGWWRMSGLDLLGNRAVIAAALFGLALFLPIGVYDALWARYLSDLGASQEFIGLSLTLFGIPLVLLSGTGGRLVDRYGARLVTALGLAAMVPVLVLYGTLTSYVAVVLVAMVEAVAQSLSMPGAQAAMARACPPDRVAAGQGLSAVTGLSAAGLLGSIAPAIYASHGPFDLFVGLAIGVGALAALGFALSSPATPGVAGAAQTSVAMRQSSSVARPSLASNDAVPPDSVTSTRSQIPPNGDEASSEGL